MRVGRAAAATAVCLSLAAFTTGAQEADRIWSNGRILTMNDKAMRAEAVAERGGKIVAVGPRAEVVKLRGPRTQMIDLKGRTMVPGFIDAHGHVLMGGIQALSANLLAAPDGNVKDIPSLLATLREWAQKNDALVKRAGFIVGFGYDPASLAEQRHPTRDELDTISKDLPVLIVHQSGHLGAINTKALELVGYTAATPDPAGGVIRRRQGSKEPDGVLEETALYPVLPKTFGTLGIDGGKALLRAGVDLWARFGYTTGQDGRGTPAVYAIYKAVADEGGLKIDVASYTDVLVDRDFAKKNFSPTYTNRLRVAGVKLSIDGSPQGFTAWRDRPYYKPVGNYPKGYAGYQSASNEQTVDSVAWARENGMQVLTHANGEAAMDLYIAALTLAKLKHPDAKDTRPVLIHGQFMREDQVEPFKRLGVLPSLFPMHTFYWGDWHTNQTVGPVLAQNISPTGWVRKRGMIFTSHHDAPVAFPDSMRVLDATVTRRARGSGKIIGPQHRVDVITALKAMTLWPAYQHFEEKTKGSIEVGKLADFAILSRDPTQGEPTTIASIKVVETIKEGATIFALNAVEQKKAALMMRPGGGGESFSRFLAKAAAHHEFAQLPKAMQDPIWLRALSAAPHDKACVSRYLDALTATMTLAAVR